MMQIQVFSTFLLLALTASITECCTFGKVCGSNSDNRIRGHDKWGFGHYGAPRRFRSRRYRHKGIDVVCRKGSSVFSPLSGTIVRLSYPYSLTDKSPYNNGVLIKGTGDHSAYKVKIWYFVPTKKIGRVRKGSKLGTSQSLQTLYPGITDHLHVQVYKNGVIVNPTDLF